MQRCDSVNARFTTFSVLDSERLLPAHHPARLQNLFAAGQLTSTLPLLLSADFFNARTAVLPPPILVKQT